MSQPAGRVLFVTGEYPPMRGGIGDYTAQLVAALPATGWEPAVLTMRATYAVEDARVFPTLERWDWGALRAVRQVLAETGAEIVHIQYQTGAFAMHPVINLLPWLLQGRRRAPWVVTTFHDLRTPYLFPKAGPVRRCANHLLATGSHRLIVTNERDRATLARNPRLEGRISLIPIGSNLPSAPRDLDRGATRERLGIAEGECAIGFFGFLTPDKGVDDLIDALAQLPARRRVRLVILGGTLSDTDAANAAYQRAVLARLEQAAVPVSVTGYLAPEQAADALAALDLVVLPFRSGASLRNGTLIAAVRSGTAVLTTDPVFGDSLAPLAGGESVWLVPPNDVTALARAISLLLDDPALRARLAEAAQTAAGALAWEQIAARHGELYASLLGR